jgi:hypothetical protein
VADSGQPHIIWHKSTASGGGSCVEVALADESVYVRNSRYPLGSVLRFSRHEWMAFLGGVSMGKFTPPDQ